MSATFTDRELDVMKVLWRHGPATVTEVREHLDDELAYTTVLTVLRTLEEKTHVGHEEEGKAHRYYAKVAEQAARRTALSRVVDRVFGGFGRAAADPARHGSQPVPRRAEAASRAHGRSPQAGTEVVIAALMVYGVAIGLALAVAGVMLEHVAGAGPPAETRGVGGHDRRHGSAHRSAAVATRDHARNPAVSRRVQRLRYVGSSPAAAVRRRTTGVVDLAAQSSARRDGHRGGVGRAS